MIKPAVSVVIATYQRLYALGELMESLSRQTYKPSEIIIVNDGGESPELLTAYYPELPLTIVDLERNMGHVQARNIGVQKASGDCILLCDDDDLLWHTHIERMVKAIEQADFVFSDAEMFNYEVEEQTRIPKERLLFAYEWSFEQMRSFSTYIPSGSMYKRSLHDEIGYFDPDVHNYWDWDFFLRAAGTFHVKRVPAASVLYAFSEKGDNQSLQLNEKRSMYLKRLCAKHGLGELPIKNFWVLLEEPEIQSRKALSEILWDGRPFVSRLVNEKARH
jgi:glycosyltransferase involved in cell wall biosynthesis